MRTQLSKLALLAAFGFALTLTLSCSGDGDSKDSSGSNIEYTYMEDNAGEVYKAVKIGDQIWMAENLNYAEEGNEGHCYNNSEANCYKYGRLYDWAAAMAQTSFCNSNRCVIGQWNNGMCPSGWHVPKDEDWAKLINYIGGSGTAGKYLKSTSGWWDSYAEKSGNGNDKYGFTALPVMSNGLGEKGCWWSSTEHSASTALSMMIFNNSTAVSIATEIKKSSLCSVRCIKWEE